MPPHGGGFTVSVTSYCSQNPYKNQQNSELCFISYKSVKYGKMFELLNPINGLHTGIAFDYPVDRTAQET